MKNDVHYLGSVRFYKHLILFVAAFIILMPIASMFFWAIQYQELKRNLDRLVNEQELYIGQLEEKLAKETDTYPEMIESEQLREKSGKQEITDEEILRIPFNVDMEEVKYILVNDRNPLPHSFEPDLVETRNGKLVHKEIKDSLERMIDDAKEEGFEIIICSAYRDYEKQANLLEESIKGYMNGGDDYKEAFLKAKRYMEMVGKSEHHTGLAVDLVGVAYQTLDSGQADTLESKWLRENAHKYGFILRYPNDKEEITGILFEAWHFRYVGEQAALFIRENQLCLEEFILLVHRQNNGK